MKTSNVRPGHALEAIAGHVGPRRAGSRGVDIQDGLGGEVTPSTTIVFAGGTVEDLGDGTAKVTMGGGSGGAGTGSSGDTISMLNASSRDLIVGDVVVVDETNDTAVTTTAIEGDTRIVGVVQEPIAAGAVGKVLFNGLAAVINANGVSRGQYAKTSIGATEATASVDREAGSFAVYLTGDDLPDFVSDSVVTEGTFPAESMVCVLPQSIPADRVLFLAVWVTDAATSLTVDGWTRVGSTAGFYYFTKVSEGGGADGAVAAWTGASVSLSVACLLHPNVVLGSPIAASEYDATTSAADVSGLADVPHYALAGVNADVATPGSGFARLAGGTADFNSGTSFSIVQETAGTTGATTFASAVTPGNLLVSIIAVRDGSGDQMAIGPSGSPDSSWTDVALNANTATSGASDYVTLQAKIATSASAGPFYSTNSGGGASHNIYMFEVSGVGVDGYEALQANGQTTSPVNIGSFASVGADDFVVMAFVAKDTTGGYPDLSPSATGYTQDTYTTIPGGHPVFWVGHRSGSGGAVNAAFTHIGDPAHWKFGVVAGHFVTGAQSVSGTLAGKYIGHDTAVTSPFTGSGQQDDAIFAFNLLKDAAPSALLYGPDLNADVRDAGFTGEILISDNPSSPLVFDDLLTNEDGTDLLYSD